MPNKSSGTRLFTYIALVACVGLVALWLLSFPLSWSQSFRDALMLPAIALSVLLAAVHFTEG